MHRRPFPTDALTADSDDNQHSGTLLRSLSILALTGHTIILAAMLAVGIRPLVIINIVSVALYGTAILLNKQRWYMAVLAIGMAEVTAHAIVATAILGWASGFHIYLLTLVPLIFFFDPWSLRIRTVVSFCVAVFYVGFAWFSTRYLTDDPRPFVEWFRYGNLFIGAIVLSALSYYYGTAVRRAQIDLQDRNEQLQALARTDTLTGLANRREALARIEWERVRCMRSSEAFSVALVDVDHFKRVNDDHGHSLGDVALCHVADALRTALRAQDTVARWGGEEFLLIMPRTDRNGALVAAEKARAMVAGTPIELDAVSLTVTVTIGVAVFEGCADADEVLKRADRAMYDGKTAGRDRVQLAW